MIRAEDDPDSGIIIIWRPLVTFNSNGGSRIPSQRLDYEALAVRPPDPTRAGYTFGGWYSDRTLTVPYDFNTPVTIGITLFARWI